MQNLALKKIEYPAIGESLYRVTLPNGLRLFLLPKTNFHETYGIMTVKFGSVDTHFVPRGTKQTIHYPAGIAHFLEHKLFEDEQGKDLLQEFVDLGAESNAFTSFTKTSYLFSTTENVEECLELLQDLIGEAFFTEESVQREQGIIHQEIEMYQDNPEYRLFFSALANLYPDTPLAEDIAGNRKSITEITVEDLDENFETFYHPSNMSLFLVGNFELEKVLGAIEEQQNSYERDSQRPVIKRRPVKLSPVIPTASMRMEVSRPKLAVAMRGTDKIAKRKLFRYKIILKLLFDMMFGWTSKRYQALYEAGRIDASLTLEVEVEESFHFVMLTMDTQEPVALSHQIRTAIKEFSQDMDVTEEHLDIVKSEMYGDLLHGLNSLEYMATQYETLLDGENLFDLPKILQNIHLEEILEVGHQFIDHCDMIDFIIFPK